MKKIFIFFLFSLTLFSAFPALSASSFLTRDEIPDGSIFLPLPPKVSDNDFIYDKLHYEWGKSIRNTSRGKQAVGDDNTSIDYLFKIFSEPFGLTISSENTPKIAELMTRVLATSHLAIEKSKTIVMRIRPFIRFNEPSAVPHKEERLKNNSSYPSGHTTMAWSLALVLAEINPANQNEILKRGFEYGQSRVIIGVHYQTDVDAARLLASALINRLQTNDDFAGQLKKARQEFINLKPSGN